MKKLRKVRIRRIDTIEAYSCRNNCNIMCANQCGSGATNLDRSVRSNNDLNRWRQAAG